MAILSLEKLKYNIRNVWQTKNVNLKRKKKQSAQPFFTCSHEATCNKQHMFSIDKNKTVYTHQKRNLPKEFTVSE